MNALFVFMIMFCFTTLSAQTDPKAYMSAYDAKVYSLKTKGAKDFVVDIESSKLLKQVNDQAIFGKVPSLVFRAYWTSNPERLDIDIVGLPEGFVEIKEELKHAIRSLIDVLLPLPTFDRFGGYKITTGASPREFIAKDQSGFGVIPSFEIVFDSENKLQKIKGNKPIGDVLSTYVHEKKPFSDGKWVITKLVTTSTENGQSMTSSRDLSYGDSKGIGVLIEVSITVEQKWNDPKIKPVIDKELLKFKNYKINTGEGLKHFLSDTPQK